MLHAESWALVRTASQIVEQAQIAYAGCGLQGSIARGFGVGRVGGCLVDVHAHQVASLLGKLELFAVEEVLAGIELVERAAVKSPRSL